MIIVNISLKHKNVLLYNVPVLFMVVLKGKKKEREKHFDVRNVLGVSIIVLAMPSVHVLRVHEPRKYLLSVRWLSHTD